MKKEPCHCTLIMISVLALGLAVGLLLVGLG
jgi:hypothetical protein